jgi:hypothetical protein
VTEKPPGKTSMLVRTAEFAGQIAGAWRQRQQAKAQDAFVLQWKEAWVRGCESSWAGQPSAAPKQLSDSQRAAWTAGWTWAQTQPNRRHSSTAKATRHGRRSADAPRLVRAAKGGAAGLVMFAATRWLIARSRLAAVRATDDQAASPSAETPAIPPSPAPPNARPKPDQR